MRKYYETTVGQEIYENTNLIGFQAAASDEGFIFKDKKAFNDNPDEICYIPEHAWDDAEDEHVIMPVELAKTLGETRNTIRQQVKDAWGEDYMLTDEQIDYLTEDVFHLADWACIDTYLAENFEIEDVIEFNSGVFTQFQKDAVANEMTPKEYADRQLSYGELIELDREFDDAFIVDEDCVDDWSDKGLGANARLTYIEERRTGLISGPDEFDCDDKWRKCTKQ
jgi:hypothetical protein